MTTLPFFTLVRIAWRSLFIQAGFSPDAMQTLGLLYALAPAWPHLYPTPEAQAAVARRHLTPFNTHPYAAAALVGGILHYELKLTRGEATAEDITRFKTTLMGPLAALGDGFFWLSLRPATGALGVALIPLLGVWAPVVFLIAYNLVHLVARAWLFKEGLELGSRVVPRLKELKVPTWSNRLRAVTAAAAAGVGAWLTLRFGALTGGESALFAALVCFVLGGVGVVLVERRVPPLALLYGAAGLAGAASMLW